MLNGPWKQNQFLFEHFCWILFGPDAAKRLSKTAISLNLKEIENQLTIEIEIRKKNFFQKVGFYTGRLTAAELWVLQP